MCPHYLMSRAEDTILSFYSEDTNSILTRNWTLNRHVLNQFCLLTNMFVYLTVTECLLGNFQASELTQDKIVKQKVSFQSFYLFQLCSFLSLQLFLFSIIRLWSSEIKKVKAPVKGVAGLFRIKDGCIQKSRKSVCLGK